MLGRKQYKPPLVVTKRERFATVTLFSFRGLREGGFTPSICVLTAAMGKPPLMRTLMALVGGKALLATCRNTATVTTIDLSAITRVKANEHRMTVRSRLHRSRGGTRQPKPFAGRIKPSWEKSSPEMELSMNNRGC